MEAVFLHILNISISAGWFILAVILLRLILKKAPRWITVLAWGLVGIRLICPISLESVLSLIPSAETVPGDILYSPIPTIQTGFGALNNAVNPIISETFGPSVENGANPMQTIVLVASVAWIVGVVLMLGYTMVSYWRLRKRVSEAVLLKDNIWVCDHVDTPFILGIIKPRIYLPSAMVQDDVQYVIAHEKNHLHRKDHWWKPLGFLLLSVYWFNPLVWVGYVLLCRDIEFACDEKVLAELGPEIKKSYSETLINCSIPRRALSACPLAFGESDVKQRIQFVLHYKKPGFWVVIGAVVACVAVAICFLTNPKTGDDSNNPIEFTYEICPVERSGNNYGSMVDIGGVPPKANVSSIQALPTVKITSVTELKKFKATLQPTMNFDLSFWDTMTFNEIVKSCNDAYFREKTLILVYTTATAYSARYLPAYVTRNGNTLSVGITESTMGWGDSPTQAGWLICISVPNEAVKKIDVIDARMHDRVYTNDVQLLRTYVYVDTFSSRKPTIVLQNNGTFSFVFTSYVPSNNYDASGSYYWLNDRVTLKTYDGNYTYHFDVVDGNLVFDGDASSGMVWFSDIVNGAVFRQQ